MSPLGSPLCRLAPVRCKRLPEPTDSWRVRPGSVSARLCQVERAAARSPRRTSEPDGSTDIRDTPRRHRRPPPRATRARAGEAPWSIRPPDRPKATRDQTRRSRGGAEPVHRSDSRPRSRGRGSRRLSEAPSGRRRHRGERVDPGDTRARSGHGRVGTPPDRGRSGHRATETSRRS